MGHHFIPQAYLLGFATERLIWAYDRTAQRRFRTQVKSVGNETDMYGGPLEIHLTERVEQPADAALAKIRARLPIGVADRRALAKYILMLWKRVPRARERALAAIPEVADAVLVTLMQEMDAIADQHPELAEKARIVQQKAPEIVARHRESPDPNVWRASLQQDADPKVIDTLVKMNWKFLCTDHQFLTCDNPVFFFEHEGIGKPQSEMTFPLSNSVALYASHSRPQADGSFLAASAVAVREINRRTVSNATRFVYAQRDEPWIAGFAYKDQRPQTRLS